jgi:hypothetical protein
MSRESYRGAAANAWAAGADGAYLFNFPCLDETSRLIPVPVDRPAYPTVDFEVPGRHPSTDHTRGVLQEAGDPETLAGTDKQFHFYASPQKYRHWTPQAPAIARPEPALVELPWRCHEDFEAAEEVTLEIKLVGVTPADSFEFAVNGTEVAEARIERLHAVGGRDARIHAIPLDPYSLYRIDLSDSDLARGDNTLTVTLTGADEALLNEIEPREMQVDVRY